MREKYPPQIPNETVLTKKIINHKNDKIPFKQDQMNFISKLKLGLHDFKILHCPLPTYY